MRKIVLILLIFFISVSSAYSYAIKVYDEYGNRVGTYRKVGDSFEFYDFYDKKVDNAEEIIKNAPTQKTLSEVNRTLYDENFVPIGTYTTGVYTDGWRYYPRRFSKTIFSPFQPVTNTPYIVRPNARYTFDKYGTTPLNKNIKIKY